MRNAEPNMDVVEWVRERYAEYNHIVIHTARQHKYYQVTLEWLNKHNIPFTSIAMGKMPCDIMLDDKTINPLNGDWKKLSTMIINQ